MTHRNPNPILICHLHELLPSLLLSVPPQHLLAHLFLSVSHPSQLLAPHNREFGAPGFCTRHSILKVLLTPTDVALSLPPPFLSAAISRFFDRLLCAPAILSAVTLSSAVEAIAPNRLRDFLFFLPRSAVVVLSDADKAFQSCCCLRRLLY